MHVHLLAPHSAHSAHIQRLSSRRPSALSLATQPHSVLLHFRRWAGRLGCECSATGLHDCELLRGRVLCLGRWWHCDLGSEPDTDRQSCLALPWPVAGDHVWRWGDGHKKQRGATGWQHHHRVHRCRRRRHARRAWSHMSASKPAPSASPFTHSEGHICRG